MKPRFLIAALAAVAVAVTLALITLGRPASDPVDPLATPAATGTPVDPHAHTEAFEIHQGEGATNPILSRLPHRTPYWELNFLGSREGRYVLEATVFFSPGEDPAQKVEQQKPYILDYLRSTGQPEATYFVEFSTQPLRQHQNA